MATLAHEIAHGSVARLLAREARLLGRAGTDSDAAHGEALARLLRDPDRLARALSDDRHLADPHQPAA